MDKQEKVLVIQIHGSLMIHINEIKKARRTGNYVEIWLFGGEFIQQWDEDERIINQIRKLTRGDGY